MMSFRRLPLGTVLWLVFWAGALVYIGVSEGWEFRWRWLGALPLVITVAFPFQTHVFCDPDRHTLDLVNCATRSYFSQVMDRVLQFLLGLFLADIAVVLVLAGLTRHAMFPEFATFRIYHLVALTTSFVLLLLLLAVLFRCFGRMFGWLAYLASALAVLHWSPPIIMAGAPIRYRVSVSPLVGRILPIFKPLWPSAAFSSSSMALKLDEMRFLAVAGGLLLLLFVAGAVFVVALRRETGMRLIVVGRRELGWKVIPLVLVTLIAAAAFKLHSMPVYEQSSLESDSAKIRQQQALLDWRRNDTKSATAGQIHVRVEEDGDHLLIHESFRILNPERSSGHFLLFFPVFSEIVSASPPVRPIPWTLNGYFAGFVELGGLPAVDFTATYRLPRQTFSIEWLTGSLGADSSISRPPLPITVTQLSFIGVGFRGVSPVTLPTPSPYFNAYSSGFKTPSVILELPARFKDYDFAVDSLATRATVTPEGASIQTRSYAPIYGYSPAAVISRGKQFSIGLSQATNPDWIARIGKAGDTLGGALAELGISRAILVDGQCIPHGDTTDISGQPPPQIRDDFDAAYILLRCLTYRNTTRGHFYSLLLLHQIYVLSSKMRLDDFRDRIRVLPCYQFCEVQNQMFYDYLGAGRYYDPAYEARVKEILHGFFQALEQAFETPSGAVVLEADDPNPLDALEVPRPKEPPSPFPPVTVSKK